MECAESTCWYYIPHTTEFIELLRTVLTDICAEQTQQLGHVSALLAEIIAVARIHVPVVLEQQPPYRIGGYTVHPCADRSLVTHKIHRAHNDILRAENRENGHDLGLHIAYPYKAVTLYTVPQILLHI